MPTIAIPQGNLALSGIAPSATGNSIPGVVDNGAHGYLKYAGGSTDVFDGTVMTEAWAGTLQSDGSAMAFHVVRNGNGIVYSLRRTASNTIEYKGFQSNATTAVFSCVTAAVPMSLGRINILASCDGTNAVLRVVHAGGILSGTNTPGSAGTIDFNGSDWWYGQNGLGDEFLDAITNYRLSAARFTNFADENNIEQFVQTSTAIPRDGGPSGTKYFDDDALPDVFHKGMAADHVRNYGYGRNADDAGVYYDTDPQGVWAADFDTTSSTVIPGAGTLTLSGAAVSMALTGHHILAMPQGDLTISGQAPQTAITANPEISIGAGQLTLTGFVPIVAAADSHAVEFPAGQLVLSLAAPDVTATTDVVAPPVVPQPGTSAAGSGFTARIDYRERDRIVEEIKEIYADLYRKVEEDSPIAIEVAAAVAKYADDDAADLPAPSDIDWAALAEDGRVAEMRLKSALEALERELAALKARRAEQLDDEDDEEMLLMVA